MSDKESKLVVDHTLNVIDEIQKETRRKWRRARLKDLLIVGFAVYIAIWIHSAFMNTCISTDYLTNTQAAVCSHAFWPWYSELQPGPQYSVKHPVPQSTEKP